MASPLALIVGSSFNQIVFANAKEWQRERKMKKGARIAMQRGLQFMQHQPPSAPGHGIPAPFLAVDASDARQVDLTGTIFHRWERTSMSHVNAGSGNMSPITSPYPPYISGFTSGMDTGKDLLPFKLTDTQANNNTGVHGVWPAGLLSTAATGRRAVERGVVLDVVVGSRKDKLQVAGACSLPARRGA